MLKHVEMDSRQKLSDQFADPSDAPVILINLFEVDPADTEHFKRAWRGCRVLQAPAGVYLRAAPPRIGNSSMWLNYAVFESARAFGATTQQPEFGPLRRVYPDSATAHPDLFRRVGSSGICIG